ncbi:DUF4870 domain-containing protein [Subtercola sp. PAMC28395]|uniref:DUF4870 domain-containing protein n=1 Tax=Subtercola sp. PAMC28395 TaxID=2846775 RepID=UPI001C0BB522|nr:DUF4870 domain-containing protein [Subtercola sp. PAMC28395]QWT23038.1 DUF4870 domain-containing protein [Subtercola sp. PAMC28395]
MSDPNATPPYDPNSGQPVPPPPAQGYAAAPAAPLSQSDDKLWASLAHFGNIILLIPALVIYLVFKDRGPLVNQESKEALNWTINVTGAVVVLNILGIIPFIGLLFGLLVFAVLIVNLIFAIIGGVRVNGGGTYRYPLNYRWIK